MTTRTREPWYDSDNPTTVVRGATWRWGVWLMSIVVILTVIIGVTVGIKTLTASPAGQANAYRQKESGDNRIFAQQYFEQASQDIEATKAKITRSASVENPTEKQRTILDGLQQYCSTVVAEYNARSRSYTTQDFKAADLPATYDPATDCEPTR